MNLYCIAVRTGMEEKFKESVEEFLQPQGKLKGKILFLRKKMRLKNGKEYFESFFPGYVFLETDETNPAHLRSLEKGKYFLRYLPSNQEINPLSGSDLNIVSTIKQFGSTVDIQRVTFDKGDRIVIVDGPFADFSGKVVAVNRRNKRVNIALEFMGAVRIVSLAYEVVEKQAEMQ